MYVFERAAEFKAQTERVVLVTSRATVRSLVYIAVSTFNIFKTLGAEKPQRRLRRKTTKAKKTVEVVESDDEIEETNEGGEDEVLRMQRELESMKEQLAKFSQLQSLIAAASVAPTPAPTQNTPITPTPAPATAPVTANTSSAVDFSQAPPCPVIDFSSPPPAPVLPTQSAPSIPKPAPMGIGRPTIDLSNRPKLKPVNREEKPEPPKPTGGPFSISASDLRRPLRRVHRESMGGLRPEPIPEVEVEANPITSPTKTRARGNSMSGTSTVGNGIRETEVVVAGKVVKTRMVPGEENMSFSDLIRVASKLSLRKACPRSPGGTPAPRAPEEQPSAFSKALLEKFKNANARRGSIASTCGLESVDNQSEWA